MRIDTIEVNKEINNVMTISGRKLRAVIVKFKGWFGRTKVIKAFPTSYGPPGTSGRVLFFYFCDEKGEELSYDISQQINNFLLGQEIMYPDGETKYLTDDEILKEAEGRYPVKTHNNPDSSPYVASNKGFEFGAKWAREYYSVKK